MILDFFGKLHPLLVHLPIGFFLLAFSIKVLIHFQKINVSESFFRWILGLMAIVSVLSIGTGLAISKSGDYSADTLDQHKWSAIAFLVLTILLYISQHFEKLNQALWLLGVLLLCYVGHLGGTLTHGADFLMPKSVPKPIENPQEALVYEELVKPILEQKCYSCHGTDKQKGKLRLDSPDFLKKGGKKGATFEAFHSDKSLMISRILLPESDEEHMPPKGKPQITEKERQILEWWINQGADFNKRSKELAQDDKIKGILNSLGGVSAPSAMAISYVPEDDVSEGSAEEISQLNKTGILVNQISVNSNYLNVNLRGKTLTSDEAKSLAGLSKQIIWLNASGCKDVKELSKVLEKLKNLRMLYLNNTGFNDNEMNGIANLEMLQFLNISNTLVSDSGISQIKALKNLKKIYLYQTKISKKLDLLKTYPKMEIDTGGYSIKPAETDTVDFYVNK